MTCGTIYSADQAAAARSFCRNADMGCAACGLTDCGHPDLVYAGLHPLPAAAPSHLGGRFLTGGVATPAAGGFVDQRAGNCEAQRFRGGVEGVPVHDRAGRTTEAARS